MSNPPIGNTGHVSGLTSVSTGRQEAEGSPKLTQPTADKSPVRLEEVTHPGSRTLDDLHPRDNAGASSPSFRHHEEKRTVTVEDVREPFEAAVEKIEAEAIETIDVFTEEFVKGLGEAERDVKQLGQTIERGFGGIREELRAQGERWDEFGKRFQSGLAEDRAVRKRILDTLKQTNREIKETNALQDETIQIVRQSNDSTNQKLTEMRAKRITRNRPPESLEAESSSSKAPSTKERLEAMRAKREAQAAQRKAKEDQ